jgi:hypothetical protein
MPLALKIVGDAYASVDYLDGVNLGPFEPDEDVAAVAQTHGSAYFARGLWALAAADDSRRNGVLAWVVSQVFTHGGRRANRRVVEISYDAGDLVEAHH